MRLRVRRVLPLGVGVSVVALHVSTATVRAQDFNGDGFADLAIGTPREDIGAIADTGAVTVIYGSGAGGLDAFAPLPSVRITQSAWGIEVDEPGDLFGSALAWGDFNADGFDDLAIGAPGEDTGFVDAGAVAVVYGSPGGLAVGGPPYFLQPFLFGADPDEAGDAFGAALASGDFNGDGFADLAMGAPGEDLGAMPDAGLVHINHGDPAGIFPGLPAPFPVFDQSMPGLDPAEPGDAFGGVLATGDFDGDGADDLAISCEFEDIGANVDAGGVTMVPGVLGVGLIPPSGTSQWWHQNSPGVPDAAQASDRFGAALATGDFDLNRSDDLAIGAPGETLGANIATGVVHVLYGDAGMWLNAFVPVPTQYWHQNVAGVPSANAVGDEFGAALAAFYNDGPFSFFHLAIGVPGNDVGPNADAGSVIVLYTGGLGVGLSATAGFTAPELWHQNIAGIPEAAAPKDRFGSSLTIGDFDGNLFQDLAVGVPWEDVTFADDGCVNVIYGVVAFGISLDAFVPIPAELWHQNRPGIPDSNETGDEFGTSLDRR